MIVVQDHILHILQEIWNQEIHIVTVASVAVPLVDIHTPAIIATILYVQCVLFMLSVKHALLILSQAHKLTVVSAWKITITTLLTMHVVILHVYNVIRLENASNAGQDMSVKTVKSLVVDMEQVTRTDVYVI
jgi:hypothetical protein